MTTVIICALLSLPAGWVARILIERVPDRRSLLRPFPDLRPDRLGWAVHAATTALFAVAGWRFEDAPVGVLAVVLVLFTGLIALAVIDIVVQRLPDAITGPLYVLVLGGIVAVSIALREPERIRFALIGGLIWVVCLGVGWLIGMGFGDVKAGGIMGLAIGWMATSTTDVFALVLYALLAGMVAASLFGVVDLVRRRMSSKEGARAKRWFALGPFLVAGAVAVVLFHGVIVSPDPFS